MLLKVNFILIASHDDFIIDIRDVHAEPHIILKVVSHYSSNNIKANVGFGVSHMGVIVYCWPAHVPINDLRLVMWLKLFQFISY